MSFTHEQLEALEVAIAQGATSLKYQDKEIRYANLEDMFKTRDLMRKALGMTKNTDLRLYAQFKNGL